MNKTTKAEPQAKAAHTSWISPMARRTVDAMILAESKKAAWTDEALTLGEMAEIIDRETAAPVLLTALKDVMERCEVCENDSRDAGAVIAAALAAIAQAEGQT